MNGIVTGGLEFVWAAYALTGTAFLIYAVMVITKVREARSRVLGEGGSQ